MTTCVLVHGAFGDPAELAPVIPELEALGYCAIAVDLPGKGSCTAQRALPPRASPFNVSWLDALRQLSER